MRIWLLFGILATHSMAYANWTTETEKMANAINQDKRLQSSIIHNVTMKDWGMCMPFSIVLSAQEYKLEEPAIKAGAMLIESLRFYKWSRLKAGVKESTFEEADKVYISEFKKDVNSALGKYMNPCFKVLQRINNDL